MNRIEFVVEAADAPGSEAPGAPRLAIVIDGVRLQELVRPIERSLALAEVGGDEDEAPSSGGYAGLDLSDGVFWPSRHFLGEPELSYSNAGDTVLLGCPCGLWGCWPLSARVDVTDTKVTWSGFFNGMRRSWDLAGLGPYVFDRRQYEASLRDTAPPSTTPLSEPPPEYLQGGVGLSGSSRSWRSGTERELVDGHRGRSVSRPRKAPSARR